MGIDFGRASEGYQLHLEAVRLRAEGNLELAEERWREALALSPGEFLYLREYADCLARMRRWEEDLHYASLAAAINPNDPETVALQGGACGHLGKQALARLYYERLDAIAPNTPTNLWNMALWDLLHGDYEAGWEGYRWGLVNVRRLRTLQPEWDGSITDKPLFVWGEQGIGDMLMLLRFLKYPGIRAMKHICLELPQQLVSFAYTQGLADEIRVGSAVGSIPFREFEHCSLLSLPRILKIYDPADFWQGAYLQPKSSVCPFERDRKRIGVCWKGSPVHGSDEHRSIKSELFGKIVEASNCEIVSLVPGEALNDSLSAPLETWDETAALISHLDLVITVDTAVAHLAGAMNKPVWILIPYAPDWRWNLNYTDTTPWYPEMRLFRQELYGDWGSAIAQVRRQLQQFLCPVQ